MNSRAKGARGERLWRDELRKEGFTARRGQQFAGGTDSPDVICEELKWLHQEVKFVQNLSLIKPANKLQKMLMENDGSLPIRKTTNRGRLPCHLKPSSQYSVMESKDWNYETQNKSR